MDSRSRRNKPMSRSENHIFEFIILDFAKYLKSCFFSVVGTVEINRRPTSHKCIAISTGTVTTIVVNIYDTVLLLAPLRVFYTH